MGMWVFAPSIFAAVDYNLLVSCVLLVTCEGSVNQTLHYHYERRFSELCSAIDNVDIVKIIPGVINGHMELVKFTGNGMDELVATSFVNEVDMSKYIVFFLIPIFTCGMREKKVASF